MRIRNYSIPTRTIGTQTEHEKAKGWEGALLTLVWTPVEEGQPEERDRKAVSGAGLTARGPLHLLMQCDDAYARPLSPPLSAGGIHAIPIEGSSPRGGP